MKPSERWIWACGIVIADLFIIFVPVAAVVLAYALITKPVWFKEWVGKIYAE